MSQLLRSRRGRVLRCAPTVMLSVIVTVCSIAGCGAEDPGSENPAAENAGEATPAQSTGAPEEPVTESDEPASEELSEQRTPAPSEEAAPINLLEAAPTSLAVSSVYRGHDTQALRMVGGDPETAWNSETGDLVGAWFSVRIPDAARVTGGRIIVGFTHENNGRDLFVANQRVSKLRVWRGEQRVGEFELDTDDRSLQPIEFQGPGGTYRFEVIETLTGTNADWREVCIPEFQLMGHLDDPQSDRLPLVGIGEHPERQPTPDREAARRAHRQTLHNFARDWSAHEDEVQAFDGSSGDPNPTEAQGRQLAQNHTRLLTRLARLTLPVDGRRADPLRRAALRSVDYTHAGHRTSARLTDLAHAQAAMEAIANWLDDPAARCRVARAFGAIHLHRILHQTTNQRMFDDMDDFERTMDDTLEGTDPAEEPVIERDLWDITETLTDLDRDWFPNTRGVATQLARTTMPPIPSMAPDWRALQAAIQQAQTHCGW